MKFMKDESQPARRKLPASIPQRMHAVTFASCLALVLSGLGGCRSAFVETTIRNDGDTPVKLIEVDYPSASFGTQALGPHSIYHYRFKVQGSGPVTLTYTGADGKSHTATGPTLDEGQHGGLTIAIDALGKVAWTESLVTTK
jgi:hypothetical protein